MVYHKGSSVHDSAVNSKFVVIIVVGVLLIAGLSGLFWYADGRTVSGKAFGDDGEAYDTSGCAPGEWYYWLNGVEPLSSSNFKGPLIGCENLGSDGKTIDSGGKPNEFWCPTKIVKKEVWVFKMSTNAKNDTDYVECGQVPQDTMNPSCISGEWYIESVDNQVSGPHKGCTPTLGGYLFCPKSGSSLLSKKTIQYYKSGVGTWQNCMGKCGEKLMGQLDTKSPSFHCDGSQWTKCDSKTKGTSKESATEGKEYFCAGEKWVETDKCSDKTKSTFILTSDKDYFCDGKTWVAWDKCNAKAVGLKQKDNSLGSFICDQSVGNSEKWKKCENNFCPLNKELSDLNNKLLIPTFISTLVNQDKKKSDVEEISPDIVGQAVDLGNYVGRPLASSLGVAVDGTIYQKVYFKFKKSVYVVQIKEEESVLGKVVVDVKSLKDVNLLSALATVTLQLDQKNPLKFPPKTVGVDLEGDKTPEVYVTATGFFEVKGDVTKGYSLGKAKVLVLVSPYVDVVSGNGKVILASDNPQEFAFNGPHPIVLTGEGDNQVLYIDQKSNYVLKNVDKAKGQDHYTSKDKTQFVNFKVPSQSGLFAVLELSSAADGGGGLKQVYEDKLVAGKELFFGMGVKAGDKDANQEPPLSICADDPPKEVQGMSICHGGKEDNIKAGGVKFLGTYVPYVLWYVAPVPGEQKIARAFSVFDLNKKKQDGTLEVVSEPSLLFTTNLADGRRVALHVEVADEDKYYLLSHPEAQYFDFQQLNLTDISDVKRPMYKSEGDKSEVVFNLPLKKQVNVKLNFGEPTVGKSSLTYELSSTTQKKTEVNLLTELQASVSTYGSTPFKDDGLLKDLGTVAVSENDISLLKDTMRVKYGTNGDLELSYRKPVVVQTNALLYYHTFTSGGLNAFTKYADVYLFYDLTDSKKSYTHSFDDTTFILPIVKGRKMAFKLESTYYLLRYNKPWTAESVDGFDSNNLELTSMDGVTTYAAKPIAGGVQFDVDQKQIQLVFDTKDPKDRRVTFKGVKLTEFGKQSVDLGKEFAGVLPSMSTKLEIKDATDVTETIRNCDSESTKEFGSYVLMCVDEAKGNIKVVANEPWVRTLQKDGPGKPDYVLWFKGKSASGKDVAVQKRFDLKASVKNIDWVALQKALALKNQPVFEVNKNLYELSGGKELSSFVLKKVPSGESYSVQMQSSIEGGQNGTIALGENLVFLQQSLVDDNTKLTVTKLDEKLVIKEGFNVSEINPATPVYFVSNIGQPVYKLEFTSLSAKPPFEKYSILIFDTAVDEKVPFYKSYIPAGVSKTVLLPNGQSVTLEVPKETKVVPPLIIKQ